MHLINGLTMRPFCGRARYRDATFDIAECTCEYCIKAYGLEIEKHIKEIENGQGELCKILRLAEEEEAVVFDNDGGGDGASSLYSLGDGCEPSGDEFAALYGDTGNVRSTSGHTLTEPRGLQEEIQYAWCEFRGGNMEKDMGVQP